MKKFIKIQKIAFFALALFVTVFSSCSKNSSKTENALSFENIQQIKKNHSWYYFTGSGFEKIDLPQNAPFTSQKPWTETVRISSALSLSYKNSSSEYTGYALVNRLGLLAFCADKIELFSDASIFTNDTAGSLVFSDGFPVFYLYRSTFFNEKIYDESKAIQKTRPFLVEFNPSSKIFYPLVSYENLGLSSADQITNFFWNGKTWTCSAKMQGENGNSFNYFQWSPPVALTDLNPVLSSNFFEFSYISEEEFKKINLPKSFDEAPFELKEILSSIPQKITFCISWRNQSGTSAVSYFHQGKSDIPLDAFGAVFPLCELSAAVFADGTTYIKKTDGEIKAFRLPKLPAGFSYGEFLVSENFLYVAWEESEFYKSGRSGFICLDLSDFF